MRGTHDSKADTVTLFACVHFQFCEKKFAPKGNRRFSMFFCVKYVGQFSGGTPYHMLNIDPNVPPTENMLDF